MLLRLQNCGRGQPWILSDLAGHPQPTRGDAQRTVPDPFDSPPDRSSVSRRTTLDSRPVGERGYHPLSARSQLRGMRRVHSALRRKPKRRLYSRRSGSCAIRRSWTSCAPTDMTLVWWCRPAPAICRPGFASVPLRWNRPWRPPPAGTWRVSMVAIWPAPTGVTWDGSPDSPIKNPHDAHRTATPRG